MHFFFKTDANENIGSGHLQRCLNIASLIDKKNKITFLFHRTPKLLIKKIKKKFNIINLINNEELFKKNFFLTKEQRCLIIDDYKTNYSWEKKISKFFVKVLVIDDEIKKKHFCDYYLNQNIIDNSKKKFFLKNFNDSRCMLGPRYALIEKKYSKYSRLIKKKILKNIIISFGGSDRENLTGRVLQILSKQKYINFKINVILGPSNNFYRELKKKYLTNKNIFLHKNLSSLSKLNFLSNLAIGSAGISSWERLCVSLPSIVFLVSNNQKIIIEGLKKRNLIIYAGKEKKFNNKNFEVLVDKSILNYKKNLKIMEYGRTIVDGNGSRRLLEIFFPSRNQDLKMKKADYNDLYNYYNWVNDRDVIKNSFTKKFILFDDHKKWFLNQLKFSKKNYLYIFYLNQLPIGQVRLNCSNKICKIDYSVDKDFRGRGFALQMIKKIIKMRFFNCKKIIAEVKKKNIPSIKIFKKLGFKHSSKKNKIIFYKFAS
jgi:UDP-2,4-diacetamido-2,4,6-trideoxy-beta-L-altropyranose hydrolase